MIDIRIMASPKRAKNVARLCSKLGLAEDAVTWDDRPNGGDAMYTARKAWLHPLPDGVTHRLVLQDDVEVCEDFAHIIDAIASTHPRRAVTGISFLQPSNYPAYNGTPYYRVNNMPGCAIMLPADVARSCMEWCDSSTDAILKPHDDLMISKYCREHSVMMIATFPCIVQHPDDDTLLGKTYSWRRTSKYYDSHAKADWCNRSILLPKNSRSLLTTLAHSQPWR